MPPTDATPTPAQRAEWKRLCDCLAGHLTRPLTGRELTEEILACAVPPLLAALEGAEKALAAERQRCIAIIHRYLLFNSQRAVSWHEVQDAIAELRSGK